MTSVRLSQQAIRDLQFWKNLGPQTSSATLWHPPTSTTLHMDASNLGLGATLRIPHHKVVLARGFWMLCERKDHINLKEMTDIKHALQSFSSHLLRRRINLFTDRQVVQAILTKMTSPAPPLMQALRKIFYLLAANHASVAPPWIPTSADMLADALSRETDREDWAISQKLF